MSQFWRSSAITLTALFLEATAFYLIIVLVSALFHQPGPVLPYWAALVTLLWAYLLSLYAQTTRFSLNLRGAVGLGASIISVLLLANFVTQLGFFPIARLMGAEGGAMAFQLALAFGFIALLWWRGGSLAHDDVTLDTVRTAFQWGLAVIFLAILVDAAAEAHLVSGFLVVGFFGLGLLGLSLARFAAETGQGQAMSINWLAPIGVTVAGVLLLGLIISALGLGGLDDVTRAVFGFVGDVVLVVTKPILLGVGYLVGLLVQLFQWLAQRFGGDLSSLQQAQQEIEAFRRSVAGEGEVGPPAALIAFFKWSLFLLLSGLVGFALFRLFRFKRFRREAGEVQETRESLFSWKRANQDLFGFLGGWWRNLVAAATREERRLPQPQTPREYYHGLLTVAERRGRPRQPWQTPREHQRGLWDALPADATSRIVDDFQADYYGAAPPDAAEQARLRESWEAIREDAAAEDKPRQK